jgi:hypothetical protein
MRKIALSLCVLAALVANAHAQATQAQIQALIQQNLASGNPSALTAAKLRAVLLAMLDSLPAPQPVIFANLPPCTGAIGGSLANITDSTVTTWGTSITTGGGSNMVLAYCDNNNWTVAAQ